MFKYDNTKFCFKQRNTNGVEEIYDRIRKKWYLLTPEEWVRQNFIEYITTVLNYPASLISIEKKIIIQGQAKRFDILVYKENNPWMLIECKSPEVRINKNALSQILSYFTVVQSSYVVLTNGKQNFCLKKENNNLLLINEMPSW